MSKVLGIDLGTTNSCMAVIDEHGRPRVIPNSEGQATTPSVILFRKGERIVGERARHNAVAMKKNIAMLMKTEMYDKDSCPFIDDEGGEHTIEELSAIVLRKLKQDAEKELGKEITKAVISVPADFEDFERNRTKAAGEIAGFEVLRIINEPTAAALTYGLDQAGQGQKVMVFDLGGGTFDVTIIEISGENITVLSTMGNKSLGGANFDAELVDYFVGKFQEETGTDPTEGGKNLRVYQDFLDRAEMAKKDLSIDTEVFVGLSASGHTLDLELTRQDFVSLISTYIDETIETSQNSLEKAGLKWENIDKILLVGGSTRIPAIRERLQNESGKVAESGINPDEVVAMGAAMVGATEEGQKIISDTGEVLDGINITDVTGHTLGVVIRNPDPNGGLPEICSAIIPSQTSIPTEMSDTYETAYDNQVSLRIRVVQGESIDPDGCSLIGEGQIDGLPPKPKGEIKVLVTLSYDRESMIHLKAVESATGKKVEAHLQDPSRLNQLQIDKFREGVSNSKIK